MKKLLTLSLILTIFMSCKKNLQTDVITCLTFYPEYLGKWELRTQTCVRGRTTIYTPGNINTISLDANGHFFFTGALADTGTYEVIYLPNNKSENRQLLKLKSSSEYDYELTIKADTLSIDNYSTVADGCGYTYKKL